MKELPIGTEIKLPFTTLKVETVRGHSCENCFFIEVCEENGEFVSESFGGCDTLLNIIDFYEEDYPNEEQVKQLTTLSLHLIQRMKPLCEQ